MVQVTQKIIEEATQQEIMEFKPLGGGIVKPTYLVHPKYDSPFVLQYVESNKLNSLEHELHIIRLLGEKTDIPVPKLLSRDLRSKQVPGEFIIKEYIPEQNLRDAGHNLSREGAVSIYTQLGAMLSSFHQVCSFSGLGGEIVYENGSIESVPTRDSPLIDTVREYELQRWLYEANACAQTPFAEWAPRFTEWITEQVEIFADDIQPCLAHGDFSATNIMVSGDRVTGLLDFEGTGPGHAIQDISRIYSHFSSQVYDLGFDREDLTTDCLKAFWDSYDAPLPENYKQHLEFFQKTRGLGYFSSWSLIEASYDADQLSAITQFIINRLGETLAER